MTEHSFKPDYLDNFDVPPVLLEPNERKGGLDVHDLSDDDYGNSLNNLHNKTDTDHLHQQKVVKPSVDESGRKKKSSNIRLEIVELIFYFIYLIILSICALSMKSTNMSYLTQTMMDLFVTNSQKDTLSYEKISTIEEIWEYIDNQLIDGIYWSSAYNSDSEYPSIYIQNQLIGPPRIRMLKVKNTSCSFASSINREFKQCFGSYSKKNEDKKNFGPDNPAFIYIESDELKAGNYWGEMATYGGGGFTQNLSVFNRHDTVKSLNFLKENKWIDESVRAIFIDFSTFNPYLNLFCSLKFVIELSESGLIMPDYLISSMKLIRYVTTYDYFILVCEILFCIFTICHILQDLVKLVKSRCSFFNSFWNFYSLVNYTISIFVIYYSLKRYLMVKNNMEELTSLNEEYFEMNEYVHVDSMANNLVAVLVILSWIKVFKYYRFNKTTKQLYSTMREASSDIGGFMIMFLFVFFAYAQFGLLTFGSQLLDYSSLVHSLLALFKTILGDSDFRSLQITNRVSGPIFYLSYVFIVFFVLLNMFLAIISVGYDHVRNENEIQHTNMKGFLSSVKRMCDHLLSAMKIKKKKKDSGTQEKSVEKDYNSWKETLLKCGYTEEAIDLSFFKYNIDENSKIETKQRTLVEHDLGKYVALMNNNVKNDEINGKTMTLTQKFDKRVDKIETKFGTVFDRITDISTNMNKMKSYEMRSYNNNSRFN